MVVENISLSDVDDLLLKYINGSYTIEEFTIADDGDTTYRPKSGTIYSLEDLSFTANVDELLKELN